VLAAREGRAPYWEWNHRVLAAREGRALYREWNHRVLAAREGRAPYWEWNHRVLAAREGRAPYWEWNHRHRGLFDSQVWWCAAVLLMSSQRLVVVDNDPVRKQSVTICIWLSKQHRSNPNPFQRCSLQPIQWGATKFMISNVAQSIPTHCGLQYFDAIHSGNGKKWMLTYTRTNNILKYTKYKHLFRTKHRTNAVLV
jgi:hypothetical protein